MSKATGTAAMLSAAAVLAGCSAAQEQQSILNPAGPRAEAVHGLWTVMLIIGAVVWLIVVVAMVIPLVRRRRKTARDNTDAYDGDAATDLPGDRGFGRDDGGRKALLTVAVSGAVIPAVVITAVAALSTIVLKDIDPSQTGEDTRIEVTGHQFWWEIRYPDLDVVAANEIHIPIGERVSVEVTSADVIHSFWVPELSGKIDLVPGRANQIWIEADAPGTYWGQCAEFCGAQHAKMRFVVVAHEPDEFAGWAAGQQEPASMPVAEDQTGAGGEAAAGGDGDGTIEESGEIARGREVFLSSSCVYCHTVAGTPANGELGPDLTHLASRDTLAAGVLSNTRGNLAGWILDPQSIKPGNLMPGTDIDGEDLQALLTYLESLE